MDMRAAPSLASPLVEHEPATLAAALMQSRQTILPKRLVAPGPDAKQLGMIFHAAATAPDHGQLLPWRFVLVPQAARGRLADVFGAALIARDAQATLDARVDEALSSMRGDTATAVEELQRNLEARDTAIEAQATADREVGHLGG